MMREAATPGGKTVLVNMGLVTVCRSGSSASRTSAVPHAGYHPYPHPKVL